MTFLAAIFAGLGRAVVGGGWISRGIVYPITAAISAYLGFGLTWEALGFGVAAAVTMWVGWTKWDDQLWMSIRYGLLPWLVAAAFFIAYGGALPCIWAFACTLTGTLYWAILETFKPVRYEIKGYVIDASRIAEFIAGSIIVGGIGFL